jgi:hypothetical protein
VRAKARTASPASRPLRFGAPTFAATALVVRYTDKAKAGKHITGVKRHITPDTVMATEWQDEEEPVAKRPATDAAATQPMDHGHATHPLDHGHVLEAEFIAAEVAARNKAAKQQAAAHPLDHGHMLEAEFIAAEVASLNNAAKQQAAPHVKCQVCGLSRDKWQCRTPLYLNALDQPVQFPGAFCSKDCFEHI